MADSGYLWNVPGADRYAPVYRLALEAVEHVEAIRSYVIMMRDHEKVNPTWRINTVTAKRDRLAETLQALEAAYNPMTLPARRTRLANIYGADPVEVAIRLGKQVVGSLAVTDLATWDGLRRDTVERLVFGGADGPDLNELAIEIKCLARELPATIDAAAQAQTPASNAPADQGPGATEPKATPTNAHADQGGAMPETRDTALTPEMRAILLVNERLKATGRLPTKTQIAKALDVDRRTLNNWRAFRVAYAKLKHDTTRSTPKGTKDKDGTLEAWRESGK